VTDFRGENLTGSVFDDVEAELNRRYPGRAKMRPDDADGYREAWAALERLWPQTVARARRLDPDPAARTGRRRVFVHRDAAPPGLRHRRLEHRLYAERDLDALESRGTP
jgi:hypothetical protein